MSGPTRSDPFRRLERQWLRGCLIVIAVLIALAVVLVLALQAR